MNSILYDNDLIEKFQNESRTRTSKTKRWSKKVTERSNVLDLGEGVFHSQRSKENCDFSKGRLLKVRDARVPYQSAMSMLNFYINRAGKKLPEGRRRFWRG